MIAPATWWRKNGTENAPEDPVEYILDANRRCLYVPLVPGSVKSLLAWLVDWTRSSALEAVKEGHRDKTRHTLLDQRVILFSYNAYPADTNLIIKRLCFLFHLSRIDRPKHEWKKHRGMGKRHIIDKLILILHYAWIAIRTKGTSHYGWNWVAWWKTSCIFCTLMRCKFVLWIFFENVVGLLRKISMRNIITHTNEMQICLVNIFLKCCRSFTEDFDAKSFTEDFDAEHWWSRNNHFLIAREKITVLYRYFSALWWLY